MRIKLALVGKEHVADVMELITGMTIGDFRTIKRETGMTVAALKDRILEIKGGDDGAPVEDDWDVYAALVYLILSRSGGRVSWAEVEDIPVSELAAGLSVLPDEPTAPAEQPQDVTAVLGG